MGYCEVSYAHAIPYLLAVLCWSLAALSVWCIQGPIRMENIRGASDGQTTLHHNDVDDHSDYSETCIHDVDEET